MGRTILSILICTVPNRKDELKALVDSIAAQCTGPQEPEYFTHGKCSFARRIYDRVEILTALDSKVISIGMKRNALLECAQGEYVAFIDDDDKVGSNYVSSILEAAKLQPDCIGFLIDCNIHGKQSNAISSLKYKFWANNRDGFKYVRSIYHKTPVRRGIALKVKFPDMRHGEDAVYSKGLQPHLKTEYFINEVMYYYIHKAEGANRYGEG